MTKQLDIGFTQAPYALDAVEDGRIRLIATGAMLPEVKGLTLCTMITHADALARRRDVLARYLAAYRETLDWMYASPDAIKAYAAWSGLAEPIAKRALEYFTKEALDPVRVSGLDDVMADAMKFKYLAAPLSKEQLVTLVQIPASPK
jgi:NitT/TauT family transport system substrate-binding protein